MEYDKRWLPTRAVGYLRTSADRAEPGYTLGIQRREVESWAADHNVYIAGVFVDEGEAGSATLERRAGLTEALATVAELENGALVVYRLSCLDPDPLMQTLVESEVRRVGRRVFSSLDHPRQVTFDLDFRVSDARYQRAQASLRRRVGRLRKHHTGGYAYGAPPTGYRAVGGQLVPDPAGQRALERARELRAAGASLRTIAAALTAEGHPTKRGGRWQPTQVSRLLRRSEGKAPAT